VHVLVLLAFRGDRPPGMVARHFNDDPSVNCLANPTWGTPSDNSKDIVTNGNHPNTNKVICPRGHPYSEANTYRCPSGKGGRQCRACHRARRNIPKGIPA
jgi:hypothetical protein